MCGSRSNGKAVAPETLEPLGTKLENQTVVSKWKAVAAGVSTEVTYTFRLWNKSLVIDTVARGGNVAEVRYGHAEGLDNPRLVTNPFYHYGYQATDRPAVAISGSGGQAAVPDRQHRLVPLERLRSLFGQCDQ